MTTISRKRKRKYSPLIPFTIVTLLVVLVLGVIIFRSSVANVVWLALEQALFLGGRTGDSMGGVFAQFTSKATLQAENDRLRAALATSSAALLDRQLLLEENRQLLARLGRKATTTTSIFAQVLLRPPAMPYDTLMIDIGKRDGVRTGNFVSPGGTVVVGTVEEVYDSTSRVVLFSAPGTTHQGLLSGTIPVAVRGQGGGSLLAEVPVGENVAAGDVVTFPGTTQHFSAQVVATEAKEGGSFITAYLSLPVNIFSLRYVEVLPNTTFYEED